MAIGSSRVISRRRGAILVAMMVCIVLISLILGALLKLSVAHRRQGLREQERIQARWLAESGVERAANRLSADSDYAGETWEIAAENLGNAGPARVEIQVKTDEGRPDQRVVTAVAVFPADRARFAKRTKQLVIQLNAQP